MAIWVYSNHKMPENRNISKNKFIPREERYPGIIMELKWKKNLRVDELDGLASEALVQIDGIYDAEIKK